jgi:hypothetical protein
MPRDSNKLVSAARAARGVWNDRTIIYFANHNEADTTFEYFNDKTEWRKLRVAALAEVETEIESAASMGTSVWFNKGAMELIDPEWLARYAHGKRIRVELPCAPANYAEMTANPPPVEENATAGAGEMPTVDSPPLGR